MPEPAHVENRLRAVSDALLLAVEELSAVESQKRHLAPGDPRFSGHAAWVRATAVEVLRLADDEDQLARAAGGSALAQQLVAIEATAPRPPLAEILAEWRRVEREIESSVPGSVEADDLILRFNTLRGEYAIAMRDVIRDGGATI